VDQQYAGTKAALRPIYEKLLGAIKAFGKDIEVSPKKAYVSLRRGKQFAIIQPSTATRLDVGINLKGTEPTERLELSGSFNAMVTHRVRVTALGDVDKELLAWLKKAYEAS
jgi:predicted transport protein